MTHVERPVIQVLTPAERARTALAACGAMRWRRDGQDVAVPFVEESGSLLLMVTDELRDELLGVGAGCLEVDVTPSIGSVRMSGDFWPVARTVAHGIVADLQGCHVQCVDCPGRRLSQVVGLQIDQVELKLPGQGFCPVDLDAYVLAQPDWVLAVGVQVQSHLNTAHADSVVDAAVALSGQSPGRLLVAQVDWVDGNGFELSAIDDTGGRRFRCDFAGPVDDPERLSDTMHDALDRVAAGAGRPPALD